MYFNKVIFFLIKTLLIYFSLNIEHVNLWGMLYTYGCYIIYFIYLQDAYYRPLILVVVNRDPNAAE